MKDVLEQLQGIIKGNLPEAVGKELRKYLAKAEENAKDLDRLEKDREDVRKTVSTLKVSNTALSAELMTLKANAIIKEELDKRDRGFKLEIAELKTHHAISQKDEILSLVDKVFGHPKVTVRETGTRGIAVEGGGGTMGFVNQASESKEITTEEIKG